MLSYDKRHRNHTADPGHRFGYTPLTETVNGGRLVNDYTSRSRRTFYFLGVTTGESSIMKVFPRWAEHLSLDASIEGMDFPQHDEPAHYREAVEFIKHDSLSLGGLVTTHKLDLFNACGDLFEGIGPYTELLGEASSISKRGNELWAHAKDPITSGLSLEIIVKPDYWSETDAELCILGAGGSSLALTLYLINKRNDGGDAPRRIHVTNRSSTRLEEMRSIHHKLDHGIEFSYHLCPDPTDNDTVVGNLASGSMVVNATGLGKDAPGSPLTDTAVFPENGHAWEFNYRGDLLFVNQARSQKKSRNLHITDGWDYFIYGWTRVMAEVFHTELPVTGPAFEALSQIAAAARLRT
jgi:shikimate dehydrogenase